MPNMLLLILNIIFELVKSILFTHHMNRFSAGCELKKKDPLLQLLMGPWLCESIIRPNQLNFEEEMYMSHCLYWKQVYFKCCKGFK